MLPLVLAICQLTQSATFSWAAVKTYYVATIGSDSNPGTQASPFKTIQKAATLTLPGDTVLVRGGSYKERVIINRSGTSSAKITFKPEPSTGKVYLKNPATKFPVNQGVFELYSDSYIRIEGFHFKDSPADHAIIISDTNSSINFKTVFTTAKGDEVVNNTFENIGNAGPGSNTIVQIFRAQDILVQGNTFVNCYGLMVNIDDSYRVTVKSNSMTGMKGSAFTWTPELKAIGIWHSGGGLTFTPGSGILIGGFNTYDNNHIYSPISGANTTGIRLDARAHSTTIVRNRVHHLDFGIYLESGVNDCVVQENISYNHKQHGYNTASAATSYPAARNLFSHNVAYNNGRHGFCIRNVQKATFKNNISFNNGVTQVMTTAQSVGTGNVFKNNLWFSSTNSKIGLWNCPVGLWNGKPSDGICVTSTAANKTSSEWVASSGESKSISVNPLFVKLTVGTEDFHLQSSSPARGKGEGGVDMGAYPVLSAQLMTSVGAEDGNVQVQPNGGTSAFPPTGAGVFTFQQQRLQRMISRPWLDAPDQAGNRVNPLARTAFIQDISENASIETLLEIKNLSPQTARVRVTLVDHEGRALANHSVQVPARGLAQIPRLGQQDDDLRNVFEGSLHLKSDQPISAWATQTDRITHSSILVWGVRGGASKILIPSAANLPAFSSSLVVSNLGTTHSPTLLRAYDVNGKLISQTVLSIAPGQTSKFENVLQSLGVTNDYGPIEISSTNELPLVARSQVSSAGRVMGSFEGLDQSGASSLQVIPLSVNDSEAGTNLGINNPGEDDGQVSVQLIGSNGAKMGERSASIPAKGLVQMADVVRTLMHSAHASVSGSYLRVESTQPVYSWVSRVDPLTRYRTLAVGKSEENLLGRERAD
jgi:hypothetical protein